MGVHCQIPDSIEKLFSASHCNVAFIGGSLTVGVGASNTAETSWRALFLKYLYAEYHRRYHCQVSEVMGGIGACESYIATFTLGRNVLPARPSLAFVEFAVNDMGVPDRALVLKGMEGIVRQLLAPEANCNVIIIGAGNRENTVDHADHRRVAAHYDLPFIDVQRHLHAELTRLGRTWDDISIPFETNDPYHLNDLGNQWWFEAVRHDFEEQVSRFQAGQRKPRRAPLPPPLLSDELQHVTLVDVSRPGRGLTLEGDWKPRPEGHFPWYFDAVLAGAPGARIRYTFNGTAVAVFGLMHHNGLKLDAVLDGQEIKGAYLRHVIEFGKGLVLAHGLAPGEHTLTLTVAPPSKRHNKLEHPAAEVACLGVTTPPAAG